MYNSQTGKVVYSKSVKFHEYWLFDEGKSSSGTLHMDGGASIQELQPVVAEGDTTISLVWIIMRLILLHSKSPLAVLFLQLLPT